MKKKVTKSQFKTIRRLNAEFDCYFSQVWSDSIDDPFYAPYGRICMLPDGIASYTLLRYDNADGEGFNKEKALDRAFDHIGTWRLNRYGSIL